MNDAKQLFKDIPGSNQKLVVVSDLHLGDTRRIDEKIQTSVLDRYIHYPRSGTDESWEVRADHLSDFLESLGQAKNEVHPVGDAFNYMILLGDIFDTSLATFQETIANVQAFLKGVEDSGLVEEFIYMPGNHDHHFWQMVNESYSIVDTVKAWDGNDPKQIMPSPYHQQTDLAYDTSFLNTLTSLPIHIVSPNALCHYGDGQIAYVFHHGHLFSKAFILVSEVFEKIFGPVEDLEELEALNAGWTELGWFHIGQTRTFGEKVELLYNKIRLGDQDAQERISKVIDEQWAKFFQNMHWTYRWLARGYAAPGKWFVKNRLMKLLRRKSEDPGASGERTAGISEMMEGIKQYMSYLTDLYSFQDEMDVRLVFGHTHHYGVYEPEQSVTIAGKSINLKVYNCGAWQEKDAENNRILTIDAAGVLKPYPDI